MLLRGEVAVDCTFCWRLFTHTTHTTHNTHTNTKEDQAHAHIISLFSTSSPSSSSLVSDHSSPLPLWCKRSSPSSLSSSSCPLFSPSVRQTIHTHTQKKSARTNTSPPFPHLLSFPSLSSLLPSLLFFFSFRGRFLPSSRFPFPFFLLPPSLFLLSFSLLPHGRQRRRRRCCCC